MKSPSYAARVFAATGFAKQYGGLAALRDVSFSIQVGEVVALIGPNGSGKSTLLDSVAGLLAADGGTVDVDGLSLERSQRSRVLFYLPDGVRPWPDQTVDWGDRKRTRL